VVDDSSPLIDFYIVSESPSPSSDYVVELQSSRGARKMGPTKILLIRSLTTGKVLRIGYLVEEVADVIERLEMHSVGS
jgi:hypothetical protein